MKEPNQKCAPSRPTKPNLKNKDFAKWSKAESCKREDNLVSTEWHEMLKKTEPFLPVYGNKPVNMIYLMSGEYGRLWKKERDEWYAKAFVLKPKEKDMINRSKKIRKEIREQKKAAAISIEERKERRAKELEAKAKAEAERLEKIRAKVRKFQATKLPPRKNQAKETKQKSIAEPSNEKEPTCPEGTKPVEAQAQCECSDHNKEAQNTENKETTDAESNKEASTTEKNKIEPEKTESLKSDQSCVMCEGYYQQLKDIQDEKTKINKPEDKPSEESEKKEENPE